MSFAHQSGTADRSTAPLSHEERSLLKKRMEKHWPLLSALPQVRNGAVPEGVARSWLESVCRQESSDSKVHWHVRRAEGWGGSEAYLLAWHHIRSGRECPDDVRERGYGSPAYQSIDALIDGKLLRSVPEPAGFYAKRGLAYEDIVAEVFESVMRSEGYRIERALDLEDRIRDRAARPADMPSWLVGNPDAIYRIDGRLTIVDFKAPAIQTFNKVTKSGLPIVSHDAQLHHYGICSQYVIGAAPEHMAVVYLSPELYEQESTRDRSLFVVPVPRTNAIERMLLHAGDELWNECVLRGRYPTYAPQSAAEAPSPDVAPQSRPQSPTETVAKAGSEGRPTMPTLDIPEPNLDCDTPDLLRQLALFHAIKTAAAEAYDKLREATLGRINEKTQQTVAVPELGSQAMVTIGIKRIPDPEHAYRLAVNAGANPIDLHVPEMEPKAMRALHRLIVDARAIPDETIAALPPTVTELLRGLSDLEPPKNGRKDQNAILDACKRLHIDTASLPTVVQARVAVTMLTAPGQNEEPTPGDETRKPRP